jgi:biopolymer transport protein TolR
MSMLAGSRQGASAEINITPLIDILLVLLIIFMVIVPQGSTGENAEIPQARTRNAHELDPDGTIVLQLLDAGEGRRPVLKINQEEVSWGDLGPRLRGIFQPRPEQTVFVKGDPEIDFKYVAQAVDLTRRAGADRIGLMGPGK